MTDVKCITVAQCFLAQAMTRPDQAALAFPDITFSYSQLRSLVESFALRFRAAGLTPGAPLHIRSEDSAVALPATLAAALLGHPVTSQPIPEAVVVTDTPMPTGAHILVDASFSPALFAETDRKAIWDLAVRKDDTPWFHCPKSDIGDQQPSVALSQATMVERAMAIKTTLSQGLAKVAVLCPPTSYHGLSRRLATLLGGGVLLEMGPWSFLRENAVTDVILPAAATPALLAYSDGDETEARCEILGPRLANSETTALLRVFREVSVVLDLAQTGAAIATTTSRSGHGAGTRQDIFIKTDILDLAGLPAKLGRLRLWLDQGSGHWLAPGLCARQTDHGIDLLGPAQGDETILVAGTHLDAALLDAVISATDGIEAAVAFASPKAGHDEVLVFAIFEDSVNRYQVVRRVEIACRDAFGASAVPSRIRPIEAIPLLSDGRPDRKACAEMILRAAAG